MRRSTLDLVRCPRCRGGSLVPDDPDAEARLVFGPVRCLGCTARFPVGEGLIDFVGERGAPSGWQKGLESPWVARGYERYFRPAVERLLGGGFDRESEYVLYRALLGAPKGPVVDLGCGTGLFTRRLARDLDGVAVVGLDVSRPMIEEALAQAREASSVVDFVRAEVPDLPFQAASLGAVLQAGSLPFFADLDGLLAEIARVLRPRGRYVASAVVSGPLVAPIAKGAQLHLRSERELREACDRAGLVRFERVRVPPLVVISAEKP